MKTIFFTLATLFSFSNLSAQEAKNQDINPSKINIESSKTCFFKALIEKNNFDITLKNDKKEVTTITKKEFNDLLLEKNSFVVKRGRVKLLASNDTSKKVDHTTNPTDVATLLP